MAPTKILLSRVLMLTLLLISSSCSPPPQLGSKIPVHTSGLMLVRVTSTTESDLGVADAGLFELVKINVEKSTGCSFDSFLIQVASSGMMEMFNDPSGHPDPKPAQPGPRPGTFKVGNRYWLATSWELRYASSPCAPNIIGWWSAGDRTVEREFEEAVRNDIFKKHPCYSPEDGIKINYFTDTGKVFFEVFKDEKLLWKNELPGTPDSYLPLWFGKAKEAGQGFEEFREGIGILDDTLVMSVSVKEKLPADNLYGLPSGEFVVRRAYDLTTGTLVADFVFDKYVGFYNLKSSKRFCTVNYRWNPDLPTPKNSTIPNVKGNLEKIVRQFNQQDGKLSSETRYFSEPGVGWQKQ